MKEYGVYIFVFNLFYVFCNELGLSFNNDIITAKSYVFWPNATIPFYINPDHFDHEQSLAIMTALSMFAFKTCLKFVPVMTPPSGEHHALVFTNPDGKRRCMLLTDGHSMFEPHTVVLGYDCLQSPHIDMMIMKALGFSFEHNRASRDLFIEVLMENIEPSAIDLFTKDPKLPLELRSLPYDINSVMHFGYRDYSKNGHRTMIFKDHNVQQNRVGLTPTDLRKIEIVYGPECLKRDRQEKIDLCQSYPGVARKKRSLDEETTLRNLRVNRDITPPPEINITGVDEILKDLGIEDNAQNVLEEVNKLSAVALSNARVKYCNNTKPDLRTGVVKTNNTDILGILEMVAEYAKNMVDNAVANLTEFCEASKPIEFYQRACPFYDQAGRCVYNYYKSTKSGLVKYSTQHRPVYVQSTRHPPPFKPQYHYGRSNNNTEIEILNNTETHDIEAKKDRKKRHIEDSDDDYSTKGLARRFKTDKIVRKRDVNAESGVPTVTGEDKQDLRMGTTIRTYKSGFRADGKPVDARKSRSRKQKTRPTTPESDVEDTNSSEEVTTKATEVEKKIGIKLNERPVRVKKVKKIMPTTPDSDADDNISSEEEVTETVKVKKVKEEDIGKLKEEQERLVNKARQAAKERTSRLLPKTIRLSKANEEFYDERKWPDGIVPFLISRADAKQCDTEAMRHRIQEVNDILRRKTCVRLQEIRGRDVRNYTDYIVIDTSPDYVTGRVGGRQNFGSIELFRGDQHRQHTAMMVLAMLGFYFEVARHDRDKYIRVHMRHIRPDKLHHFEKIRDDATFALPYDYESATHPAWQFWRKIGKVGLSSVATYKDQDPDGSVMKSLGQNEKLLSDIDLIKINSVYGIDCFRKAKKRERIESDSE